MAAGLAVALAATACGGSNGTTTGAPSGGATPSISADPALAAMVPAAIKADGKIVVGTDSTYAPVEFLAPDGKTIVGFDVDLFNAVARKLGLTVTWVSAPFDSIITGVGSGKYEVGVSAFTVNPDREKQANMVTYFSAGTQWATRKGNPNGVSPDQACGKRVAVQASTVQVPDLTSRSQKCTSGGKPAITIDQYQGQDDATAAVVSGKDDAMLADSPVVAYAVQRTNGQLDVLGSIYDSAPYGYVVKKDDQPMAQALQGAVQELIKSGTYQQILGTWGVEGGAITTSQVNP
ncbi:MAG TPA: ABC transporter substrate-binding protein [Micromonosporaceae bacterium]